MKRTVIVCLISLLLLSLLSACAGDSVESASEDTIESTLIAVEDVKEDVDFSGEVEGIIQLIYSHDGAPDDIATLVYITKHPNIELLGVIQSYGEQHPGQSLEEWQVFLYDVIDYDQAVFGVGAEESLDPQHNEFPSGWRSGADEFWWLDLPETSQEYPVENGADLIIDLVKNSEEKVTILVTGAQTDVALAIQQDASIAENISQIVIMGGAFNVDGNLFDGYNSVAEWNIYVDPLAAKVVFNSGIPLSIVSLDGSDSFEINRIDHANISSSTDPALVLLSQLWENSFQSWGGNFKIWDIVAAVALTNPEYFTWTYDGVDVNAEPGETHGQTFVLNNDSLITRYTADTDYKSVREAIFDVFE